MNGFDFNFNLKNAISHNYISNKIALAFMLYYFKVEYLINYSTNKRRTHKGLQSSVF